MFTTCLSVGNLDLTRFERSQERDCEKELRGHSRNSEPCAGSHISCYPSSERERGFCWQCTLLPSPVMYQQLGCSVVSAASMPVVLLQEQCLS